MSFDLSWRLTLVPGLSSRSDLYGPETTSSPDSISPNTSTADPKGHSYRPEEDVPPTCVSVSGEHWHTSHDYLYGCDLYNHGYWWEAHEAWEAWWQLIDKSGPEGQFLQGLIQAAACALKAEAGNATGVRRLLARSESRLRRVLEHMTDPSYMGLELEHWLENVRAYYGQIAERDPIRHDPDSFPYLRLTQGTEPRS